MQNQDKIENKQQGKTLDPELLDKIEKQKPIDLSQVSGGLESLALSANQKKLEKLAEDEANVVYTWEYPEKRDNLLTSSELGKITDVISKEYTLLKKSQPSLTDNQMRKLIVIKYPQFGEFYAEYTKTFEFITNSEMPYEKKMFLRYMYFVKAQYERGEITEAEADHKISSEAHKASGKTPVGPNRKEKRMFDKIKKKR